MKYFDLNSLFNWFLEHGIKIVLLIVGAMIIQSVIRFSTRRAISVLYKKVKGAHRPADEIKKRTDTLSKVIVKTSQVILVLIIVITVLTELAVNVSALITGMGIAGIAVGFGAQGLVRDVVSGLFIILEDQYGQGDYVEIAGKSGKVIDLNLRRTILQSDDKKMHYIPNKEITIVTRKQED